MWQIFKQFFLLGWVSFGGPAAHLGYFQRHFVTKLGWLEQAHYAQLIALSQVLPGPGSSQVGFAIGYQRAGLFGGLAAFVGFTAPSFAIMVTAALLNSNFTDNSFYQSILHCLKLFAVVVVADAVLTMSKYFWAQRLMLLVGVTSSVVLLLLPGITSQLLILAVAALFGMSQPVSDSQAPARAQSGNPQWWALGIFALLFVGLPLVSHVTPLLSLFSEFFQAGALVFGGGHVVLPLLQEALAGQITTDNFLLGYALAQAIPGPMFTLASFLGADLWGSNPLLGAAVATLAIFAPGLLLMVGLLNHWQALVAIPRLAGAIQAVNAAVVGLLLSAWCSPVVTSSVTGSLDVALVLIGFLLLRQLKLAVLYLLAGYLILGVVFAF